MFGRTALAARESGIADALSYLCGVGFAVRFYGGWRRLAAARYKQGWSIGASRNLALAGLEPYSPLSP